MTWQIAQGTVDFRNEELRHRNRTDQIVQVRREVSDGSAADTASSLLLPAPPAECLCPNCLTACDEFRYCDGCGKVVKA